MDFPGLLKLTRKKKFSDQHKPKSHIDDYIMELEKGIYIHPDVKKRKIISQVEEEKINQGEITYNKKIYDDEDEEDNMIMALENSSFFEDENETKEDYKVSKDKKIELEGSRIIPIKNLVTFLKKFSEHCLFCNYVPLFTNEYKCGLYSEMLYKCFQCQSEFTLCNSNKIFEESLELYSINLTSVLSSLSTGMGYSAMKEIFSLHDLKYMKEKQYKKNQEKLNEIIKAEVDKSINNNYGNRKKYISRGGKFRFWISSYKLCRGWKMVQKKLQLQLHRKFFYGSPDRSSY